jgi:hypothetical protein
VVHVMVRCGPGSAVSTDAETFPTLSAFIANYRKRPLDIVGTSGKGTAGLRLGECVSRGLSLGGGARPSEADDLQQDATGTDARRVYHTVVVRCASFAHACERRELARSQEMSVAVLNK